MILHSINYIRPNCQFRGYVEDHIREKSNLYGVTILSTIDTEKKQVEMKWSVCHGKDNFSKSIGKKLARNREFKLVYNYDCAEELSTFDNLHLVNDRGSINYEILINNAVDAVWELVFGFQLRHIAVNAASYEQVALTFLDGLEKLK